MNKLYGESLAKEWIDWVETPDPEGIREQEIFPFIEKWVDDSKPKILVDLGCGQGVCSKFVDSGVNYVGLDDSPTLIERAKELNDGQNKEFRLGDVYAVALENSSADAVMSIWVWSHLEDLNLAAQEMHRILKSDGRFLIITASPETYEERKTWYKEYSIQGKLLTGTFDLGKGKFLTDTTLYLHTKKEIETAIENAGLSISALGNMGQAKSSDKGLYLVIEGKK